MMYQLFYPILVSNMVFGFKVFSLNCWGITHVSKDIQPRMKAIAKFLSENDFDVVCLQEVWNDQDFHLIKAHTSHVLPYAHYFYSGVWGSGVCILSKHPIKDVLFHQWAVNGYIHKIHHGDWFGGKGVGLCKLRVNNLNINVYSAHLHAEYDRHCDEYQAHRVLQAFDTAQFIKMTSGDADLTVLAGDLNTEPVDLAYRIILAVPGFSDALSDVNKDTQEDFVTYASPKNSYTDKREKFAAQRIDYIMFHSGKNVKARVKKYWQPLPNIVPDHDFSYSDHEAVASYIELETNQTNNKRYNDEERMSVLQEGIDVCNTALHNLVSHKRSYGFISAALFILLLALCYKDTPTRFLFLYQSVNVIVIACLFFTVLMATLWNSIERNGIFSTKLSMELKLQLLKSRNEL